jgi:hypothetical protein
MGRTREASLSRQNMSDYKTLYVEGDLDFKLIDCFLSNKSISNVRIFRIEADKDSINYCGYCRDSTFGAKKQIIEFIRHSNSDDTVDRGKYLGIVDTDLDYCFSEKVSLENLLYTDYNSMESYLIDIELFNDIAIDNNIEDFESFENSFEVLKNNFIDFNICFITQVREISNFNNNTISFDSIPLSCEPFICLNDNYRINVESFKHKVENDSNNWYTTYNRLKSNYNGLIDRCESELLHFLHGKYLLNYLISIFKHICSGVSSISESAIVNTLKDKFIIKIKYLEYSLFQDIESFAMRRY